jgi:hypothetical protein
MAKKSICPPGVWCLTPKLGIVLGIGLFCILFYILSLNKTESQHSSNTQQQQQQQQQQQPVNVYNTISPPDVQGGDDRYSRAPEPLRVWQSGPDMRGAMIPPGAVAVNIATRGLPQAFQQMGILKSGDQVLPLYGRQTAYRTDRYNYYTRTDTYNPVQLPIKYERRDCMDSIGCGELLGGETVKIKGLGKDAHVEEVYRFDGPTYIPGIV